MVTLFLTLIGCSEDVYENHLHNDNSINKNQISFKQFKGETGIKKFESLKSVNFGNEFSRAIESEFVTDTTKILKYTSENNKVTYSFKIYPITETLESKEYYNLVYEKYGNEWNELIFLNKEREIQQIGESKLESSKMVYNEKLSAMSMSGFCEVINYTIQCDGSCNGACDGFACPTGQCIHESVSYVYCGSSGGSGGNYEVITGPPSGGGGGGGNNYSGVYIPNPYDGDDNLNNPDFVYTNQVAAFTRTLPPNLKKLLTNNFWIYQNIVDFIINNGGLTQENKDAVVFALTNSIPIFNLSLPNWTFTDINQLHYNAFIFLLENPNLQGQADILQIANNINHVFTPDIDFAIFSTSYFLNHPNTTNEQFQNWFMGESEGQDGDYDAAYWENPNLTFPAQNLPSFNEFYNAYPRDASGNYMKGSELYPLVGGDVYQAYINPNNKIRGACALKVSRALNYSGAIIPNLPGKTLKGNDNLYYFVNAKTLNEWMKKTFGVNDPNSILYPYNPNHINLIKSQGGINGVDYNLLLNNIKGIYTMIPTDENSFGASGHCDMIKNNWCPFNCFFKDVNIIDVWILN